MPRHRGSLLPALAENVLGAKILTPQHRLPLTLAPPADRFPKNAAFVANMGKALSLPRRLLSGVFRRVIHDFGHIDQIQAGMGHPVKEVNNRGQHKPNAKIQKSHLW